MPLEILQYYNSIKELEVAIKFNLILDNLSTIIELKIISNNINIIFLCFKLKYKII